MESHNLPKIIDRVRSSAERLMDQPTTAAAVLNGAINQYAMPLLRFKQAGVAPDMQSLEDLISKLLAVVASTYDGQDARAGRLP